jgi:hypothetical protein
LKDLRKHLYTILDFGGISIVLIKIDNSVPTNRTFDLSIPADFILCLKGCLPEGEGTWGRITLRISRYYFKDSSAVLHCVAVRSLVLVLQIVISHNTALKVRKISGVI